MFASIPTFEKKLDVNLKVLTSDLKQRHMLQAYTNFDRTCVSI